jgi:hypothetical protein
MDAVTQEISDRFSKSWIETQTAFDALIDSHDAFSKLVPINSFIRKLKKAGEDKCFRLGISLDRLIISRSVDAVLRTDQKYIRIETREKTFIITLREGQKMHREYTIKDLDDERMTGLLQTLKQALID